MKKIKFSVALLTLLLSVGLTLVTTAKASSFADCTSLPGGQGDPVPRSNCNEGQFFCCYTNPGDIELFKAIP